MDKNIILIKKYEWGTKEHNKRNTINQTKIEKTN